MLPDLTDTPIFDESRALNFLEEDQALLMEILEIFIETAAETIRDLRAAAASANADDLRLAAHSLRGGAANVCAERVCVLATSLETAAENGKADLYPAHIDAIEREFDTFRDEASIAP